MKRKSLIAIALWILIPVAALAQGAITGVTVEPAQVLKGHEVTITINATQRTFCTELQVTFGDDGEVVLKNRPIGQGFQLKHTYTKVGNFTVTARGISGCTGTAETAVKIKHSTIPPNITAFGKPKSYLEQLCEKVDCAGAIAESKPKFDFSNICAQPKIDGVFPGGNIRPGGIIAVKGCGFGNVPGVISLGLSQPPFHTPWLEVIEWKDGFIGARIPDGNPLDSGAIDQLAYLKVVTKDNRKSNSLSVNFAANKTMIAVAPGMVKDYCSDEASYNFCGSEPGYSFHAYHSNASGLDDSDEGWDEFTLTLKNGWQFEEMTLDYSFGDDDEKESYAHYSSGFTKGSTSMDLKIKWRSDDKILYSGKLYIIGPVGVAYK